MTTNGPLPCALCDVYEATLSTDDRDFWHGVRWYLDDRETAGGRPHRHHTQTVEADLDDYWTAIEREWAEAQQIIRLKSDLHVLSETAIFANGAATWDAGEEQYYRRGDVVAPAAVTALLAEIYQREHAQTYYLGGAPSIVRTADGAYRFVMGRE